MRVESHRADRAGATDATDGRPVQHTRAPPDDVTGTFRHAPICNHDLPLPPRTTLADALDQYRISDKPASYYPVNPFSRSYWYERHDDRERELQKLIKEQAADAAKDARLGLVVHDFAAELEAALPALETRRCIAQSVAARLKSVARLGSERQARDLTELPEQMFLCRIVGHAGQADDGTQEFAWASKCDSSKFCPDCARAHSMYEAMRYTPAMVEHVSRGPEFRAHYAVFTRPSVPLGKMAEGIAETFTMFREWLDLTVPCTDEQRGKYGWGKRKKKLPLWQLGRRKPGERYDGPGIHGALVQLECHLTAAGMWHPHLNVILLTRGDFSYSVARDAWGFNVHLEPIEPKSAENVTEGFVRSFRELIKYPFRHVAEKNLEKRAAGDTEAPPFEEWPDAAIVEWHGATRRELDEVGQNGARIHGARWLRSYGLLHGVPPPSTEQREVRWLARLTFTDDGRFFVASILGSKFQRSHEKPIFPGYRVPSIQPPPRRNRPPGEP